MKWKLKKLVKVTKGVSRDINKRINNKKPKRSCIMLSLKSLRIYLAEELYDVFTNDYFIINFNNHIMLHIH